MGEKLRAVLCLIAIATLVAFVQTLDYGDQQQAQAAAPSGHYLAWRDEMLKTTGETK